MQNNPFINEDAERSVLSAAMQEGAAARKICALPECTFSIPQNQVLFQAIKRLVMAKQPVDLITLDAELTRQRVIEQIGGAAFLVETSGYAPTTANIDAYISLVEKAALRREIKAACVETANAVGSGERTPVDALDVHAARIRTLLSGHEAENLSMREAIMRFDDAIGADTDRSNLHRMYTGIPAFDNMTGGLFGGKLIVVGARPGVGKSAFALSCALATCRANDQRVLFISLEMDEVELMARIAAHYSGIPVDEIERGQLAPEQHAKIASWYDAMDRHKLIFNTIADTPAKIRHAAYRADEKGKLALVIVDYISLMRSGERAESKRIEVGQITRALKRLAQDLRVPVLALSQLNRQSEVGNTSTGKRTTRPPSMAELRESGDVEQDANMVLLLYRPMESQDMAIQHDIDICKSRGNAYTVVMLEKNRQGRCGLFPVEFDGAHMRYLRIREG